MFTIKELVQASSKLFKQSGALVATALQLSGKKSFTLDEAKQIVEEFAARPVKN